MQPKPVLVVEDERDIRETMQLLLEDEGYEVYLANDGREALEILHDPSRPLPGLVALDFYMPVMDGRAFLRAVEMEQQEAHMGTLTVVLVTACDAQSREDLVGKTVAVLKKPVNIDKLLHLVAHYCGTPSPSPSLS